MSDSGRRLLDLTVEFRDEVDAQRSVEAEFPLLQSRSVGRPLDDIAADYEAELRRLLG